MKSFEPSSPGPVAAAWPGLVSGPPLRSFPRPVNQFSRVGIAFLVPFTYFLFSRILDFTIPQLHLPLIFGSITMLAVGLEGSLPEVLRFPAVRYLALYSFWFGITIVTSMWRGGSFGVLKDYWSKSFIIFLALACLVTTLPRIRGVLRIMTLAISTSAVLGLWIGALDREGRLRLPSGELANSNGFGIFMVLGLTLCWYGIMHPEAGKFWRLVTIASMAPMAYAAAKSGSRTVLVGFLLTLLYVFFRLPLQKKVRFALLATPLLVVLVVALPGYLRDRLATTFVTDTEGDEEPPSELEQSALVSRQARWQLLKRAIVVTMYNPIFGVGPGNFMVADDELAKQEGRPRGSWRVTHNGYAEVSSEMGLPGLALYCMAMLSTWVALRRLSRWNGSGPQVEEIRHTAFSLQMALLGTSVAVFFGMTLYSYLVPSLLGLAVGLIRCAYAMPPASPQPGRPPADGRREVRAGGVNISPARLRRLWLRS